ncbi:MAG TPA: zinc-dependent metalloprotease, partial [Pirellulaceae bacterium]
MTWGRGEDGVWSFRKVDDRVLVSRKNVRFRAEKGTPAATAVKVAYTDSVLFNLPIICPGPSGGDLVDVTGIFMGDLPQITAVLRGFFFAPDKSTWADIKGFERNTEVEVAATYASNGSQTFESVPDSRGVTLNVHYSISQLPSDGFQPRLADDRVGYFLTVVKDYSKNDVAPDRFVRYINRWDLRKSDPSAKVSPPKMPLVFWLENTIPYPYRKTIRDGIEEWNKAFEHAGFSHAIEVRQQPDDADWDPEDVNYNTFRWITSSAGYALGPSRVNPHTGQILDADILFDADFLQHWRQEFETFTPQGIAAITGGPLDLRTYAQSTAEPFYGVDRSCAQCRRQHEVARQLLLGTAALAARRGATLDGPEQEKMVLQGLKGTVMHEVGHTLGLRHNFKGSTLYELVDLNDPVQSARGGMLSSVMDYDAVNIVPEGMTQGDYFTTTIGPYDEWAIEYGYKEFPGDEAKALAKIAARSGEPELAYATDEDTRGIDPDPLSNRWDLGKDPLEFAERQARLVNQLLPNVVESLTNDGDDYSKARRAFGALLSAHGQAMYFASRYVGGMHTSRSHKGDVDAPPPFEVVPVMVQRRALELLERQVFS